MKALREKLQFLVIFITRANRIIAYTISAVLILFGAIMLYEAIARHFFNSPTTWAFEFSKMSFGFYMIWAGAYAMLCGEHVSMDIFYSKWSPRAKAIMDSVTFVFFMVFISLLLYLVTEDAINSISFKEVSNSTLAQPLYHWRASLAVGIFLLLLQGIAEFIKNLWFAVYNEAL
ncbi:TRAP transporter small permease subunit [Desulforhopalus singaporensis]|uniref:TRAP-type mannitol/chloroaromatic compound transport system, small permease component n=1 Tax=Desulforhopalus singaporensis TaxID=91360 RepID=A0A1H0N9M4_9BACT|nr:TRAP transporter small permease subunit [Desulforhopalus singaporensis]SDO89429.1 TRAP-type mannitol/chloroaromatic compound transport system, small permease component [Desulforhopalus singaporensis]